MGDGLGKCSIDAPGRRGRGNLRRCSGRKAVPEIYLWSRHGLHRHWMSCSTHCVPRFFRSAGRPPAGSGSRRARTTEGVKRLRGARDDGSLNVYFLKKSYSEKIFSSFTFFAGTGRSAGFRRSRRRSYLYPEALRSHVFRSLRSSRGGRARVLGMIRTDGHNRRQEAD